MTDDLELLCRFTREGSHAAFAELVARHIDRVYAVALRQTGHDAHLAEDVTQAAFISLARKSASLARHPALGGWLHRATCYLAADLVRAERRRRARENTAHHAMHDLDPTSAGDELWEQARPDIDATLAELTARDRDALVLRFFEGRGFPEIARRLQVSEDAARMRVNRALERMHARLARRGITSTAVALGAALAVPCAKAAPAGLAASVAAGATAASVGTAATAFGFIQIMSNTKIVSAVCAATVLLTAGVATGTFLKARAAETALRDATATRDTLRDELAHVQQDQVAADEALAALKARTEAVAAKAGMSATASSKPTARDPEEVGREFLEKHPEVREALIARSDAKFNGNYGSIGRVLGLSPEQVAQLRELFRHMDGLGGKWGADRTEMLLRPESPIDSTVFKEQVAAILGPEKLQQFSLYSQSLPARTVAAQAASLLCTTSEPLTSEQADELALIIHANQTSGSAAADTRYDWEAISEQSRGILTDAQRSVLDALRNQDRIQSSLNPRR